MHRVGKAVSFLFSQNQRRLRRLEFRAIPSDKLNSRKQLKIQYWDWLVKLVTFMMQWTQRIQGFLLCVTDCDMLSFSSILYLKSSLIILTTNASSLSKREIYMLLKSKYYKWTKINDELFKADFLNVLNKKIKSD